MPTFAYVTPTILPITLPLTAGQHIDVGNVKIWNDNSNLYVEYNTTGNWYMTVNQLNVSTTAPNSNPAPGQFDFISSYTDKRQNYNFTVPLNSYTRGVPLYILTHTHVVQMEDGESLGDGETAWGGELEWDGSGKWFFYTTYTPKVYGSIKVQKNIGSSVGSPQQGVTFNLKFGETTLTGVTNSSGTLTFENLLPGSYTLEEVVPQGYTTDLTEDNNTRVLETGENRDVQVVNTLEEIIDEEDPPGGPALIPIYQ